jgi:SAM-dependent methyltransferase
MMRGIKTLVVRRVGRALQRVLHGRTLVYNPYISAKFFPLERRPIFEGDEQIVISGGTPRLTGEDDALPVPPPDLREGWQGPDSVYLETGRRDIASMLAVIEQAGESPHNLRRVLDFGCATGRMLRFFPRREGGEYWGVDIKARNISWCQENLSPPFLFATTTTFPHLPFEDNSFDVAYCSSVFTHMIDLADATLLELRRILRPGGLAYVTVHDERSVNSLFTRFAERELTDVLR